MTNFRAFDFSSYGIENDHLCRVCATKSYPVGYVDFERLAFSGDVQITQSEESGAENYTPDCGDDEFAGRFLVERSRHTVSGFNAHQFGFKGKVVEAVEVE